LEGLNRKKEAAGSNMSISQKLKELIVKRSIEKRKKKNPFDEISAESFQLPLDAGPDQNNSYYFSSHDMKGNSLLFRLGVRGGGLYEVWFALKENNGSIFLNNRQIFSSAQSPAAVECLEPGLKWKFSFHGKMAKVSLDENLSAKPSEKEVEISFEGIFTASSPIFEFSRHMDSGPLARALAKEKWSGTFFTSLTQNHQVHYEQQGIVSGTLTEGKESRAIKWPAMRDHSFGKRDWEYMDRHIWLMALLENGDALNVNMVRYPDVSELQTGYFISEAKTTCVDRVTSMDEIECSGHVPLSFNYLVQLTDGRTFTVTCEKELEFAFPFKGGAYTIFEGIGSFSIDGIMGRGILEFGFNSDNERWKRYKKET
jgi:hypothetical protein